MKHLQLWKKRLALDKHIKVKGEMPFTLFFLHYSATFDIL